MGRVRLLPYVLFPLIAAGCGRTADEKPAPEVAVVKPADIKAEPGIGIKSDKVNPLSLRLNEPRTVRLLNSWGIDKIYLSELAQENMKRIFGFSVMMHKLKDFFPYDHWDFKKAPNQSDKEYNEAIARRLNVLLPNAFSIENQAKSLAEQATLYLYWTLVENADLNTRTLQKLKSDEDYKKYFVEVLNKYEIKSGVLLENMDLLLRVLNEAGVKIKPVKEETKKDVLNLIVAYGNRKTLEFDWLKDNLFGWDLERKDTAEIKAKKAEKLINFLSNEAPKLVSDAKTPSTYWDGNTYLRIRLGMEKNPDYEAKIQEIAKKYQVHESDIVKTLPRIAVLMIDANIDFNSGDISHWFLTREDKSDTQKEKEWKKKFESDFKSVQEYSDISKEKFVEFFNNDAGRLILGTYKNDPYFLNAYSYHRRVQEDLKSMQRAMEQITKHCVEEANIKKEELDKIQSSVISKQERHLINAQNLFTLGNLVFYEARSAADRIAEEVENMNKAKLHIKDLSPDRKYTRRVGSRMEAKLNLHQLGFNMTLLRSIPKDIMDYHEASKDPKVNKQIKEWAEKVEKYNRYMTEGTGNKPGNENYSGLWEDNGVLPLAVKMAKETGLSDRDIEEELTKGHNLAQTLDPKLIGRWSPLSFRAIGGSGIVTTP